MTQHDTPRDGLIRPVFFDRQTLTAEDLNCFVNYVRAERHRHNRNTHGWGVSNGLDVARVDDDPWSVRIGRGHAIAPSGQEMEVLCVSGFDVRDGAHKCLGLPDPCDNPLDLEDRTPKDGDLPDKPGQFLDPTSVDFSAVDPQTLFDNPLILPFGTIIGRLASGALVDRLRILSVGALSGLMAVNQITLTFTPPVQAVRITLVRFGAPPRVAAFDPEGEALGAEMPTGPTATPQTVTFTGADIANVVIVSRNSDVLIQRIEVDVANAVIGTVYLAICPEETPACYAPGLPEHCMPPGDNMRPARMVEGHRFRILCTLPERPGLPACESLRTWVCDDAHVPAPDPVEDDCVVIATLEIGPQGIVSVDEFADRRRLPPTWVLAAQGVCCCCSDTPEPQPTPPPPPMTAPPARTPIPSTIPTVIPSRPSFFVTDRPSLFVTNIPTRFETGLPSFFATTGPSFLGSLSPSIFETLVPSVLETLRPSFILDGPDILVTPGGLEFDPVRGRELGLDELTGIGTGRRETLAGANVTNLTEFIETDSVTLSGALGVSEVKIAELQEEARLKTMETTPTFDRARGREIEVAALPNVGTAVVTALKEIGVTTLSDFLETDRRVLAEASGLPLESILRLQAGARKRTLRAPG